ncbi:hypothetical protein V8E53_004780, partial [Lactarius tabidus]
HNLTLIPFHPRPYLFQESLNICSRHDLGRQLALPAMSLPSLRRLSLQGIALIYLSPLLSSATGLVELDLTLSVQYGAPPEDSLIASVQRMSCLRRLELKLSYLYHDFPISPSPSPPASARDAVPLSKLTDLTFLGHCSYLQMLVVGLAAPSLQRLDVEIHPTPPVFSIPHLCKFICDTENQFIAVSLYLSEEELVFTADTNLTSDHARPFRIIFPQPFVQLEEIGNMLSGPLSTVEELIVEPYGPLEPEAFTQDHIQWEGFFNHIRRAKMVQMPFEMAHDVVHSFQQGGLLDLLPSLEQVKVDFGHSLQTGRYRDHQFKTVCDAFEPLIAARRQAGRPTVLSRV